jgi:hypothetical protein
MPLSPKGEFFGPYPLKGDFAVTPIKEREFTFINY